MPSTVALPPLDGSLRFHEYPDFHRVHNPDYPLYVWKDLDQKCVKTLTHLEFSRGVHRVARTIQCLDLKQGRPVGIICLTDTVTYLALFLGVMKAGLVPYLISHRNAPVAIAKLLTDVDSDQVLATPSSLHSLLSSTRSELQKLGRDIEVFEIPSTDDVFPLLGGETSQSPFNNYVETPETSDTDIAFFLHSSGSTGLPKTIPQTHLSNLHWCSFQCVTEFRTQNPKLRISATMLPSFHTLGLYFQLVVPMIALCVINVAPPVNPSGASLPFVASPANLLDHIQVTSSNALVVLPVILEMWMTDKEVIKLLRSLEVVWFSGGTLSQYVGDTLTQHGVSIGSVYGGTEFGSPVHIIPRKKDIADGDWCYIRFDSRAEVQWSPRGNDIYEAIFLTTESHQPSVENLADGRGYATSDLFERHPNKNLWKLVGRADDVIVLSSGEKLVPGPAEDIINSSPLVALSMLFGREQQQVGVIVQPAQPIASGNSRSLKDFKESIRPLIEEVNRVNPGFARILMEFVIIATEEKPLLRSPKGSLQRKGSLTLHEKDINSLYSQIKEDSADVSVETPGTSAHLPEDLALWIGRQASNVAKKDIQYDRDLFEQGFDSILVSALRSRLLGHLSAVNKDYRQVVTLNWIYQHPSVAAMTNALSSSPHNHASQSIKKMIDKYRLRLLPSNLTKPRAWAVFEGGYNIIITGSTGAVGCRILAEIIGRKDVDAIYCFNRSSSSTLHERQRLAFEKQGLDPELLTSAKVHLLETDLIRDSFGLETTILDQIKSRPLIIVHVAWKVDFNLTLASFEQQIQGITQLINFAASCPDFRRFSFVSSISSMQSWDKEGPVPESIIDDDSVARGHGYGEAKYVAERLLASSHIPFIILRVGQICGSPPVGAWSVTDWFPILVKTSLYIKAIPQLSGVVSWVPITETVDIIVQTTLEMGEPEKKIINVVHPKPIPWNDIVSWVVRYHDDLSLRLVQMDVWLGYLDAEFDNTDELIYGKLPAIKLLDFFKMTMARKSTQEMGGIPRFVVSRLDNLRPLGYEDIESWMSYWHRIEFL